MRCDAHIDSEGHGHIVVDAECLAVIMSDFGMNPFSLRLTFECTCPHGAPPFGETTLLGYIVGPGRAWIEPINHQAEELYR